jgi:hypothetical protein
MRQNASEQLQGCQGISRNNKSKSKISPVFHQQAEVLEVFGYE